MDFLTADGGNFIYEIKKSRFIGRIKGISSEEEAKNFIAAVRKEESLATHNCYGYIVLENGGERVRYSDDGEPQGTAGMPILNVLKNKGFYNVVAVVTRYFGGIKLGAGGLVRAYSETCAKACAESKIKRCVFCDEFEIDFSYENYKLFSNFKLPLFSRILKVEYGLEVKLNIAVSVDFSEKFLADFEDFFNKRQPISRLSAHYFDFEEEVDVNN